MSCLRQQLHDAITSVSGLGSALCVSGTETAPLPCISVSSMGDLPLPITETRLPHSLHPTHANEHNTTAVHAGWLSVNAYFDAAV